MRSCKTLKGGLQELADDLDVVRLGTQHQAGSDACLTAFAFFKLRQRFFDDHIDDERFAGVLWGYGPNSNSRFGSGLAAAAIGVQNPMQSTSVSARATPAHTESHAIQIRRPDAINGFGTPPPGQKTTAVA